MEINIGCARFGHKSWLETFYPKGTTEKQFQQEYVKHFNAILFKATFYQIYPPQQMQQWADTSSLNPHFKFYPYFPQAISHVRRLRDVAQTTNDFLASLQPLGNMTGPLILHLGENVSPKAWDDLKIYMETLPPSLKIALELHNKKWYAGDVLPVVIDLLKARQVSFVIIDDPDRPHLLHSYLTAPDVMVQFKGTDDSAADFERLNKWNAQIKAWESAGVNSVGFFISTVNPALEPEYCRYVQSR